jgi:hypothetical protein
MTMTLKAQIAADLNAVYFDAAAFAETVTYTPVGGAAQTIKAIIDYGVPDESGLAGMDAVNTDAELWLQADATNGIASVAVNDAVTIGSETWRVIYARKIDDGLIWRCRISRSTR